MQNTKIEPRYKLYTINEASSIIGGLTKYQIREMCRDGRIKCFKAGKKYLFTEKSLIDAVFSEQLVQ